MHERVPLRRYCSSDATFFSFRYGLSNCLFAATYSRIIEQCECVPFFHTLAYDDFPSICAGPSLLCMNQILSDIGSHTQVEDQDGNMKPCFSPCSDQVTISLIFKLGTKS